MQKKQRRENVRRKIKILDIYIREREGKRKREREWILLSFYL